MDISDDMNLTLAENEAIWALLNLSTGMQRSATAPGEFSSSGYDAEAQNNANSQSDLVPQVHHQQPTVQTDEKPFECSLCPMKFSEYIQLPIHVQSHQIDRIMKPLKCNICQMVFQLHSEFEHHFQQAHPNQRPYECDKCPKKFMRINTLKEHHSQIHVRDKIFRCSECPNKVFYARTYFLKHWQRNHSPK